MPRRLRFLLPVILLVLVACGGVPAATPTTGVAPTQTRAAELGQLATLTAPTATATPLPPPTPLVAATQTRAAEMALIAILTAPTATPPPATATAPPAAPAALARGTLVGRVDNSEAYIGIVVTGADVMAYVCDGANLAQWFTGTLQGNLIDLSAANGTRLTAEIQRPAGSSEMQAARGTFRGAQGQSLTFSSAAVGALGRAGVYRGTGTAGGTSLTMGVIVLADNSLRGVLRAGQFLLPVTDPTFAANGLIVTFDEFGPVTAQRLGTT